MWSPASSREWSKKRKMSSGLIGMLKRQFPHLPLKMRQAGMPEEPEEFLKKILMMSFYMSAALSILLGAILTSMGTSPVIFVILFPALLVVMVLYLVNMPDVYILRRKNEMEREIVFMGRFLILEIEAGIPIYNALKNIAMNYEHTGKFFNWIDMGTPIEDALNEAIVICPSPNMVRILWQIVNTIKTGTNIKISLISVLDQITREQAIALKEYGKKLNPLAMMYMVIAIIFPSLGVTVMVIVTAFMSLNITLTTLLVFAGVIGGIQLMFFSIIKAQRPAVDI